MGELGDPLTEHEESGFRPHTDLISPFGNLFWDYVVLMPTYPIPTKGKRLRRALPGILGNGSTLVLVSIGLIMAQTQMAAPNPLSPLKDKKILVLEGTASGHEDAKSAAWTNLQTMQTAVGFALEKGDATKLTASLLAKYDIIVFNYFFQTELAAQFPEAAKNAFMDWLKSPRKGYIGYHSSGANEWSKAEWPWYQDHVTSMRYNAEHPDIPRGTIVKTTDTTVLANPIMKDLPDSFAATDEWYQYDTLAITYHDIKPMYFLENAKALNRAPYPIHPVAWYREDEIGTRYFYSTCFHEAVAVNTPFFRTLILRALEYVSGDPTPVAMKDVAVVPKAGLAFVTQSSELSVTLEGKYELAVLSAAGTRLYAIQGEGRAAYDVPTLRKPGFYFITIGTATGKYAQRILVY